jgi:hypothetical protein
MRTVGTEEDDDDNDTSRHFRPISLNGFFFLLNKSCGTGMRLPSHARGTARWTYVLNHVFILLTTSLVFCSTIYNKTWCFIQKRSQIVSCAKVAPTSGVMSKKTSALHLPHPPAPSPGKPSVARRRSSRPRPGTTTTTPSCSHQRRRQWMIAVSGPTVDGGRDGWGGALRPLGLILLDG